MLEFIDYEPEHAVLLFKEGLRQANLKYCDEVEQWSRAVGEFPAKTGIIDGRMVGCGGLIILQERHRAEGWIILVHDIEKLRVDHRMVRRQLQEWIREYELDRVEAPLRQDFTAGFSYAIHLGFKFEAILEKYHPDNTDAFMHVIIKE